VWACICMMNVNRNDHQGPNKGLAGCKVLDAAGLFGGPALLAVGWWRANSALVWLSCRLLSSLAAGKVTTEWPCPVLPA
jgi:hypothetical protein